MTSFIGHFHPLFVHLPIGILLLAFVLECAARWYRQEQFRPAIRWSLAIGGSSAALSALTGWFLADQGGYDEVVLQQHRWFGLGTVGLFALVWYFQSNRLYFPLFTAGLLALIGAGHYGGSLTHGGDYLWEKQEDAVEATAEVQSQVSPETVIFSGLIQPILKEKCVSCHRPEKRKGDLLLTTEEGLRAGGKHGPVFLAGQPDSSSILRRIHLELHDDHHMPPAGKPQLDPLEIQLLQWWIAEGADFQARIKEHPLPPALAEAFASAKSAPENPVFKLSVSKAPDAALEKLRALNLRVQSFGPGTPWLAVSLAGQQALTAEHWAALEGVKEQLVDLDLSHTGVQDADVAAKVFPHLIRLNLAHTSVGKGVASMVQKSPFLETLNLTNTLTDSTLQGVLPGLSHLKKLFLWQTKITQQVINAWKSQYPNLYLETGATVPDAAPLSLRSPKLSFSRSFFDDTVQLELSFPFKGVDIYYTLAEEASPTTQSPKYQEKIIVDKTAHLRAFAAKPGWLSSPIIDAVFVKKKYTVAAANLLNPPSPKYPAKGGASLIDGKIADAQGADTWLGYEGEHLNAILDLGETKEVGHVFVHCLENNAPWIHRPTGIVVSTSTDGKNFTQQGSTKFAPNTGMGDLKVHLLGCHLPKPVQARYLKVRVESLLKNPVWHPSKGQKCWIFVDEITIE